MKTFYRKILEVSLFLAIVFLIAGTTTAGYVSPKYHTTDTGLKQVPYNINGAFTTLSGVTYDSSSGVFAANNPGRVYAVTQYDRLFKVMGDDSRSPLFFAIDDKQGNHFFSYIKEGNSTLFRSGTIESNNVFSMRMLNSSGGIVTAQTALAVRNGTRVPHHRQAVPNLTGNWTTAQNSVYQINGQEENVFSGRITAHGKTTSTRFAGYIDKVEKDGTTKVVMLCEKRNLILGDLNVSTHSITVPYVLYADGRVASSSQKVNNAEWASKNSTVTQRYATVLNNDGITKDVSKQVRLLSVYDANAGRYNLTSTSDNITTIGIVQEDNSFFEYSPETGLTHGFVKCNTKYDFLGGADLAEALVHNLKQKERK